jgi:tRNA(fMet)-specific endonuclease VapC
MFCATLPWLPFDDRAAETHAVIRQELAKPGTPIGPYDLIIAATALVHDLILVTHNTGEFARVPKLRLEDWQATP